MAKCQDRLAHLLTPFFAKSQQYTYDSRSRMKSTLNRIKLEERETLHVGCLAHHFSVVCDIFKVD